MFFIASKLFWWFAAPSQILFFAVLLAALLLALGRGRAGRIAALFALGIFILFGIFPVGTLLLRPLEARYSRPPMPSRVDGILILGSGQRPAMLRLRGAPASGEGEARMLAAFELARRYPQARIVFTGGSNSLTNGGTESEADVARFFFAQMGLDPRRLKLESRARNTAENFALGRILAQPGPDETWLLATSAAHMPRAMMTAQRSGWKLLPWPTDYATLPEGWGGFFNIPVNLGMADWAVHEWIGLVVYRLRG
jgi:uncharacterized SAM-binding protein YcdF (DUF218 family)